MLPALLSSLAWPHAGGEINAIDVDNPDTVEASFGLVHRAEAGWRWVCHEAITTSDALLTPRYSSSPSGVVLGAVPASAQARSAQHTLYRSADLCSWTAVSGLDGQIVSDSLWVDDTIALAVTAPESQDESAALFRSSDGALSFSQVAELGVGRTALRVVGDKQTLACVSIDLLTPADARLHTSQDQGLSWNEVTLDLSDWADEDPLVAKVLAVDGEQVWVAVSAPGGHVLLRSDLEGNATPLLTVGGTLADVYVDAQGQVWAQEAFGALYRLDGEAFTELEDAPASLALAAPTDDAQLTLAGSALINGALLHSYTPGAELGVLLEPYEIQAPLSCPADSDQAVICEPLWELVNLPQPLAPDTGDSASPVDTGAEGPEGCGGCGGGPSELWWLGPLPFLLLLMRRRSAPC